MMPSKEVPQDEKAPTFHWCRFWQHSIFLQSPPHIYHAGATAVLLFAVFGMTLPNYTENIGMLSYLLGTIILVARGGPIKSSPIVWLAIASIGIVLISWGASWITHPHWAETSPKVHRLTYWFAMIPVAILLGGNSENTLKLWGAALLGLTLAPWLSGGGFSEWQNGFSGQRIDFGLHNAEHTAMLYGTTLLGLLALAPRMLSGSRWLRIFWFLGIGISVSAVVMSQTRAIWLGLSVGSFTLIILTAIGLYRYRLAKSRHLAMVAIIAFLAISAGYGLFKDIITERLKTERTTIEMVMQGNITGKNIPYTSTGIRLHSWAAALKWIEQKPFIGWGGNGRKLVIEHSPSLPDYIKANFGHLHSSYFDLLVSFGLLGAALLLSLLLWLLRSSYSAWQQGNLPGDILIFFFTFIPFWLVINGFESYLFYDSGRFVFALVCGGILTHIWAARYAGERQS